MNFNPVVWFEIYVQDMPRAQAFYEQVLAKKLEALPMPEGDESGLQMLAFPAEMENVTLFGNIRLGRATYALLLALLIGFDPDEFAKKLK